MAWSMVTLIKTLVRMDVVFRIRIMELISSSSYKVKRFDRKLRTHPII